jgi:hypothetical protein
MLAKHRGVLGRLCMSVWSVTGAWNRVLLRGICTALLLAVAPVASALDLGTPPLSPPLQQEKFFDTERLITGGEAGGGAGDWESQLGLSHIAREDDVSTGGRQATHRIHGEAGGKLNVMDNVSLTAIARIPLYTYEARFGEDSPSTGEGKIATDLVRNPANLSWRSEVGVNLGKGVDLNLFYDRSLFGKVDRPGVDEREEKFGTRFIIHFK